MENVRNSKGYHLDNMGNNAFIYMCMYLCVWIYMLQQEPRAACYHQFKLIFLAHGVRITETVMNRGMFTPKLVCEHCLKRTGHWIHLHAHEILNIVKPLAKVPINITHGKRLSLCRFLLSGHIFPHLCLALPSFCPNTCLDFQVYWVLIQGFMFFPVKKKY